MNTLEIDKFVKSYTEQNNREPSVEEIYDNLEDQVNKKYIDLFVERFNKKIQNQHNKK